MTSWPAIFHFVGVIFAAFGPAAVLLSTVVAQRPVFLILMVGSAFLWLCAITLVAGVWWALVPLRSTLWLLTLYAVAMQEGCRWGTYLLFERLLLFQ